MLLVICLYCRFHIFSKIESFRYCVFNGINHTIQVKDFFIPENDTSVAGADFIVEWGCEFYSQYSQNRNSYDRRQFLK